MPKKSKSHKTSAKVKVAKKATPKKQNKSVPRRKPRSALGAMVSGAASGLANYMQLKPHIRTKGIKDGMRVELFDIVKQVQCSHDFTLVFNELVNPLNSAAFKKVTAIARMFEKFKCVNLELVYAPQCPVVRSGNVAMMISGDTDIVPPNSLVDINNYDSGVVCAVGTERPAHCGYDCKGEDIYRVVAQETDLDPKSYYTARMMVYTANSASDDDGLIAGFIGVRATFDLIHARGERQGLLTVEQPTDADEVEVKGGGNTVWDWTGSQDGIGWFDWAKGIGQSLVHNVVGYASNVTYANSLSMEQGWWSWAADLFLSAVAASKPGSRESAMKQLKNASGPILCSSCGWLLASHRKGGCPTNGVDLELAKVQLDNLLDNLVVLDEKDLTVDSTHRVVYEWINPKFHPSKAHQMVILRQQESKYWTEDGKFLGPNAAGDVTLAILCYAPDGTAGETIKSTVISGGTGALNMVQSDAFFLDHPGCRLIQAVNPTGTEARDIEPECSVSVCRVSERR